MSKRIICLTCLSAFGPEGICWADEKGIPGDPPPVMTRDRGDGPFRRASRGTSEPTMADLADWLAKGHQPQCPLGHTLPLQVVERDSIVIGLVGEPGSSKSHYLAALVMELVEGNVLAKVGYDIGLASTCRPLFTRDYQVPLFQKRTPLAATVPLIGDEDEDERLPIILVMRDSGTGHETNIIFYDPSGEQLSSPAVVAQYNRFLFVADALLLFVPPVVLPGLRDCVPSLGTDGQTMLQTKGMIDELELQLRRARGVAKGTVEVTVATLLAKADLCRGVPAFDDGLLEQPDYTAETMDQTLRRIQQETHAVSRFMAQAKGDNLVMGLAARFPDITFHAVSATGCALQDGTFPSVRPTRCADPLLSVLARRGKLVPPTRSGPGRTAPTRVLGG